MGRLYVQTVVSTLDPGKRYQKQSKTEQALDSYGNLLWRKDYDYGNLTTPARTYNYTYLGGSSYTSRYIFNRLASAAVTQGAQTPTLATTYYDGSALTNRTGLLQHDSASYGTGMLSRGNPTSVSRYGAPATTMQYDITGMGIQRGLGSTTLAVTPAGNNAVPGAITVNSNPNHTTTLQWSSFLGLTQQVGLNQATATTVYDQYARPASTTSPHGAVTTYAYTNSPPTVTATVNGRWTRTTQDGLGRPVKVEAGHGSTTLSIVDTEYDACACSPLGKVKRVSPPYSPGGTVYWTTYLYEGNTVKVADAAGKWKRYTRNAMGELTKVTEPNPSGGEWATLYSYNAAGQLTQVAMTRGAAAQTRTFAYHASGFLANCHRRAKLALLGPLLAQPVTELLPLPQDCAALLAFLTGQPAGQCPFCGLGRLHRIEVLAPRLWSAPPPDSS